jgi:hypothetical protein
MFPNVRGNIRDVKLQAGLLWRIDGGDWHTSGYTLSGLSAGQHILEYQCIPGWVCPQSETVTMEDGQVLVLTPTFVRKRALPWLHLLLGYLTPSLQMGLTDEPAIEGARSGEESPWLLSSLGCHAQPEALHQVSLP